ncbi:MAG TPA: efflux RND transporter permease subunit, partial [Clostridia bacterium]
MKLTKLAITKPIATIFIVILFVLLGIMGGINLGADLFPSVNIPVIVVSSVYPGAGSDEVEKSIVKPIEDAVAGVSGIDKFSATASEGYGQVVVLFKMNADTNSAFMDTQKAVDGILSQLPKDATKPQILKIDPGASPIMDIALSGDRPLDELYGKAELLKERIERIEGVGRVSIYGASKKELQINVDKSKMEHYGLTLSQITGRLQSDNVNFPGGLINQPEQNRIVSIKGEFEDINQIKSLRIPVKQGSVRIGDIADVTLDYPTATQTSRLNQKRAIGLSIQKQSDANIVATGDKVKAELESLKQSLKGIDLKIVDDSTIFINSSLNDTKRNLIEGVITTAIILFIFLRQWNSVFIAIVAIPTSLVSTFFMMFLNRFTFNMLSLMGLALCVGILVDDSVVVMENIHRHFKMGKDAKTASLDGRMEIGMAAIAITLSDIVVFAPIAFMSGMVGQYFRQFGLVVVFATVFSLV